MKRNLRMRALLIISGALFLCVPSPSEGSTCSLEMRATIQSVISANLTMPTSVKVASSDGSWPVIVPTANILCTGGEEGCESNIKLEGDVLNPADKPTITLEVTGNIKGENLE